MLWVYLVRILVISEPVVGHEWSCKSGIIKLNYMLKITSSAQIEKY